jgi:Uma2 family endonuclease
MQARKGKLRALELPPLRDMLLLTMSAQSPEFTRPHRLTPSDYLASERASEMKHEYHDGVLVAMAGGSAPHSLIAGRVVTALNNRVAARGCQVFNSDMKVWVGRERHFFYPDASALCGPPEFFDEQRDILTNPSCIIEVLSGSTEAYDRGRKLARYMALDAIREIALFSQEQVRVDKYTRRPDGVWQFEGCDGMETAVAFPSLGCEIVLRDVYAGVELAPPSPEPARS